MSKPETLIRVEVKSRGPIIAAQRGLAQAVAALAGACWDRGLTAAGQITIEQQEYAGDVYIACWVLAKPVKIHVQPVVARITPPEGFEKLETATS